MQGTHRVRGAGWLRGCLAMAVAASLTSVPAAAQDETSAPGPNTGRLAFSGGFDVTSTYMFRGILQEDSGMISPLFGDVSLEVFKGDRSLQTVSANFGLWNSLHSGPTGLDGPSGKLWYESDFYAGLSFGFAGGLELGTIYTAYLSPNSSFGTVQEVALKAAYDDSRLLGAFAMAPYALVAFELDGQADGAVGQRRGTYLELGVGPGVAIVPEKLTLTFPVKLGMSLNDYYEGPFGDSPFGFFDVGVLAEVPLSSGSFGSLSLHGGVNVLMLGDTPKALNGGDGSKVIGIVGFGVSY